MPQGQEASQDFFGVECRCACGQPAAEPSVRGAHLAGNYFWPATCLMSFWSLSAVSGLSDFSASYC